MASEDHLQGVYIICVCVCVSVYILDHAKRPYQKRILQKHLNRGELQNRYRARWAKDKASIGLDEHRATHI